jgi:hypothetical protein
MTDTPQGLVKFPALKTKTVWDAIHQNLSDISLGRESLSRREILLHAYIGAAGAPFDPRECPFFSFLPKEPTQEILDAMWEATKDMPTPRTHEQLEEFLSRGYFAADLYGAKHRDDILASVENQPAHQFSP